MKKAKLLNVFRKKPKLTSASFTPGKKVCATCGQTAYKWESKCTNCESDKFYNDYSEYLETTYKYCSKCGWKNENRTKRCPNCGSSVFISYRAYKARQNDAANRSQRLKAIHIMAFVLSTLIVLGLFIFAIWAHLTRDSQWPGLLIMFLTYAVVMTGLLLLDILVIYENKRDYYLVWVALAISIASLIAAFVMFFIVDCTIWSMGITASLTICNVVGFIRMYYQEKEIDDYSTLPYFVMSIICALFLALSLLILWMRASSEILLPRLLILSVCYVIVLLGLVLIDVFGGNGSGGFFAMIISGLTLIAVIVLLCIRSCAIWAFDITLVLTLCNAAGIIGALAGDGDEDAAVIYKTSTIVCVIFLVISILVISFGYGWGAYNII